MNYPNDFINKIICGDCLDILKSIPDNSVDSIVTDPPYGISFMNKHWDINVPSVDIWKQCLRTLKAGSFAFIMSSPRQDVLSEMIVRIRQAGFDTNFTSLYWAYASGFPKAMNIGKMVDKRLGVEREVIGTKQHSSSLENAKNNKTGYLQDDANRNNTKMFGYGEEIITIPKSPEAKQLDGSYAGFQPKPALECIIVAMKPLSEKSFVDQSLKNGKGITWLDDSRIPYQSDKDYNDVVYNFKGGIERSSPEEKESWRLHDGGWRLGQGIEIPDSNKGRFPANLLVSDDILNDNTVYKSGTLDPSIHKRHHEIRSDIYGKYEDKDGFVGYNKSGGDEGSFSRYFSLGSWWDKAIHNLPPEVQKTFPFLINPKSSKSERNKGCGKIEPIYNDDSRHDKDAIGCNNPRNRSGTPKTNHHPTVKPVQLFSYLITLGSRPNDIILDPFIGSGTLGISCQLLSRKFIGIEINPEYCEIANARLHPYINQNKIKNISVLEEI